MQYPNNVVSLHPYFQVQPGRLEEFKVLMAAFVERTSKEKDVLYYEFTVSGETVFCREGYAGAAGLLAHLENVGDLVQQALQISSISRLEIHGPAAELDPLRGPLADLQAQWFVREAGLGV